MSAAAVPAKDPKFDALIDCMAQQTAAIGALVNAKSTAAADPLSGNIGDDEDKGLWGLPGARGACAMQKVEDLLANHPERISMRVRANRNRRIRGCYGSGGESPSTRAYLIQEVPFHGAKSAAHFMFAMGEVFDLMEQGRWRHAEAQLALLLVAGEQSSFDDWRWHNAQRLILSPHPPFHSLINVQGSSMEESISHLADPGWLGAAMSYAKDLAVCKEAHKPPRAPAKEIPAKKTDADKDLEGGGKGLSRREKREAGGKGGGAAPQKE